MPLLGGRAAGRYRRCGRWAITSAGVQARPEDGELALSDHLDVLRAEHLVPLFVDVADPQPFARRGLDVHRHAEDAVLEPARSSLASPGRRELARDVVADRARSLVAISVLPRAPVGTAELLIADAVAGHRDRGVDRLGLGRRCPRWWSGDGGVPADEVRAVVERFEPHWQPRWLALHSLRQLPAAAVALRVRSAV